MNFKTSTFKPRLAFHLPNNWRYGRVFCGQHSLLIDNPIIIISRFILLSIILENINSKENSNYDMIEIKYEWVAFDFKIRPPSVTWQVTFKWPLNDDCNDHMTDRHEKSLNSPKISPKVPENLNRWILDPDMFDRWLKW